MPYRLVQELEKLMAFSLDTEPTTKLTCSSVKLPEEVYTQLDKVITAVKHTFGTRLKPTQQQDYILRQKGFVFEADKTDVVGWKSGKIKTERGIIHYP